MLFVCCSYTTRRRLMIAGPGLAPGLRSYDEITVPLSARNVPKCSKNAANKLADVRMEGIEPSSPTYEVGALPLSYTIKFGGGEQTSIRLAVSQNPEQGIAFRLPPWALPRSLKEGEDGIEPAITDCFRLWMFQSVEQGIA